MTDLQMGMIGLGGAAVFAVLAYNKWQEHKHRKLAEALLTGARPMFCSTSRRMERRRSVGRCRRGGRRRSGACALAGAPVAAGAARWACRPDPDAQCGGAERCCV
jgi:hypothetical protein